MPQIKAILFDKDDTIIDLNAFWRDPVRKTAEHLSMRVLGRVDAHLAAELEQAAGFRDGALIPESPVVAGTNQDILNAWRAILAARGLHMGDALAQELLRYAAAACREYGELKPTADFPPLLHALRERGIRLGVATSDDLAPTLYCLQQLHIDHFFDAVFAADNMKRPKPAPDSALAFCRLCGVPPAHAAMVGDSRNDMLFAKNSGMTGILYRPGGWNGPLPEGAQHCVQDLAQLLPLVCAPQTHPLEV